MSSFAWIRVEDSLPRADILVLAYAEGLFEIAIYRALGYWANDDNDRIEDVTHWAPLPEPPVISVEGS